MERRKALPKTRKLLLWTLSAAVLLITLLPLGALESRRTPDWEDELALYLEDSGVTLDDIHSLWVAQAQHPDQFQAELFRPTPASLTWQDIRQLPPPERLRCIRFDRQAFTGRVSAGASLHEYLLVGYYNDELWHAGWLVQAFREGVSEAQKQAAFEALGCDRWAGIATLTIGTEIDRW
jgi:hypothetical protein